MVKPITPWPRPPELETETMAEAGRITKLIESNGIISYLQTAVAELQDTVDELKATVKELQEATDTKKPVKGAFTVSSPTSLLRHVRRAAQLYLEMHANQGRGLRVNEDTNELIINFGEPQVKACIDLPMTPQQVLDKLRNGKYAKRVVKAHAQYMDWDQIPTISAVLPWKE